MESRLRGKIVNRRFRIDDAVGSGGMAIVYHAFDYKTQRTVALKVLREEYEHDEEYKKRFEREAEVLGKLNHPNLVNLIASGTAGGISYIAIEYVDGMTLKELIAKEGRISQENAVRYTIQILTALSHAHQRGIIHRDVKPQNVLVPKSGPLKISDFGIAGIADSKTLSSDGSIIGSVHYFSPEQANGDPVTSASDLYSVGVILYEMLCGHVPFDGETAVSVAMMHMTRQPTPIEEVADVCPAVATIVHKALQKDPKDRYQNADDMIYDLRRALRHPNGSFFRKGRKWREGKEEDTGAFAARLLAVFFAMVMLVMVAVAGLRLYRSVFIVARVPDLMGLDQAMAGRMIELAGLTPNYTFVYSDTQEGYVSNQEPAAATELMRGESVLVTISLGTGQIPVPRLLGMTREDAETAAVEQGFAVGQVEVVISEQMRGTVISQRPQGGENAMIGSGIDMQVSGGRVVVPELVGTRQEDALSRIESLGLTHDLITYETVEDTRMDGVVLTQTPEKFTEVLPESEVELVVGFYDKRRYTANVSVPVSVPEGGVHVRVTLVDSDGNERDMYAATQTEPGEIVLDVLLRSETSGAMAWRVYLDGNFKSEATAVLQ